MDTAADSNGAETKATESEMGTKILENRSEAPVNGVPKGCTLEWSHTVHDSVVYCADIRPPGPEALTKPNTLP